jgi:hypothetical protein
MAINVSVHRRLNYDPVRDLAPVALIAVTPFVLVLNPSLPIMSVADLAALAKTKCGELSYASNGPGGAAHLFADGNMPALNDVVAGHVSLMFGIRRRRCNWSARAGYAHSASPRQGAFRWRRIFLRSPKWGCPAMTRRHGT